MRHLLFFEEMSEKMKQQPGHLSSGEQVKVCWTVWIPVLSQTCGKHTTPSIYPSQCGLSEVSTILSFCQYLQPLHLLSPQPTFPCQHLDHSYTVENCLEDYLHHQVHCFQCQEKLFLHLLQLLEKIKL